MLPIDMRALLQKEGGFAAESLSTKMDSISPYLELGTVSVPELLPGQVLIRVHLASVNPSDIIFIQGRYGQPRQQGRPAGFEGVGEVMASGGGIMANWLKGKRVAFVAGPKGSGSWAEYAVSEASTCIALKKGVRDEDGAALVVNPMSALAMFDIVRRSDSRAFVLTAGASQLSKLMIGLAHDKGYRAIAIVRREEQIALLNGLGAAYVLNQDSRTFRSELAEVLKKEQPQVFLDATTGATASRIFHQMPAHALWIIYGRLDEEMPVIRDPSQMIFKQKRIEGFWLAQWMRKSSFLQKLSIIREAQNRFTSGAWKTDVTARLTLNDAPSMLLEELAKPNGKVFICP